ncbi:unnamed protein product [Sphagnum compactum]
MASPSSSYHMAAMACHHRVAVFMTMLAGSFAVLAVLPKPVMAEYSCSQVTVVPEEAADFFDYLKAACNALLERADPNKSNLMHVEMVDSKTNQTLYVWATCGSKEDANYCKVYFYIYTCCNSHQTFM